MRKLNLVLVALLVATSLTGCISEAPEDPQESAWEVTIGAEVFAIEDIRGMETVTIEAEKKGEVFSYTGVRLGILLNEAGITEFETLTLEAEDGYAQDITREEALHDNSILAFAVDGEDISEEKAAPLMFVSTETSTKTWVGKLKVVKVGE